MNILQMMMLACCAGAIFLIFKKRPAHQASGRMWRQLIGSVLMAVAVFLGIAGAIYEPGQVLPDADAAVKVQQSLWAYPLCRLSQKIGQGRIVIVEADPAAHSPGATKDGGGVQTVRQESLKMRQEFAGKACTLDLVYLQGELTAKTLAAAVSSGAKALVLNVPLPTDKEELAAIFGDPEEEPIGKIPVLLYGHLQPNAELNAYLGNGTFWAVVSPKQPSPTLDTVDPAAPWETIFMSFYLWLDSSQVRP